MFDSYGIDFDMIYGVDKRPIKVKLTVIGGNLNLPYGPQEKDEEDSWGKNVKMFGNEL